MGCSKFGRELYTGALCLLCIFLSVLSMHLNIFGISHVLYRVLFSAVFGIALILFSVLFFRKKDGRSVLPCSVENLFLGISLILGLFYTFFMPLLHLPDELGHFYRVLSLLQGDFFCAPTGEALLPVPVIPYLSGAASQEMVWANASYCLTESAPTMVSIVNQCLYLPLCYILQVIGVGIPYIFTRNSLVLILSGRLVSGLFCTLIIYCAIKLIPAGKTYLALIALMPINLQERFSMSVDNITFAVCVFVLALCLHLRSKSSVSRKDLILLYGSLLLLASCKVVYFLLALLVLLIPSCAFSSLKQGRIHKCCAVILTAVVSLGWLTVASSYLDATKAGGNASEKLLYMILHPLSYLTVILRTQYYWILEKHFMNGTVGSHLGLMDIQIPAYIVWILYALLFAAVFLDWNTHRTKDVPMGILLIATSLLIVLAIFSSLYVQWTSGDPASIFTIEGLQGRYYAPILPAAICGLLYIFPRKEALWQTKTDCPEGSLLLLLFVLHLPVVTTLFQFAA